MPHLTLNEFFPSIFLNDSTLQQSLGEDFPLCDNGNIAFHWADYYETCDAVKEALENDSQLREEFTRKDQGISRLSLIPVWIRTDKKVHQTTMFDLYERHVLNEVHLALGVDPFGPIEISFISSTGPFRLMAITECFNKTIYKDFVMVYLLKGKLSKRDFRVRLKAKVLMEYGTDFSQASLINVEQLTLNGILFSLDSEFFMKTISKESQFSVLIDTTSLEVACGKGFSDLKAHLSQFVFNLMYSSRKEDAVICQVKDLHTQSSFDFIKTKKVHLFISYSKLTENSGTNIQTIQKFVNYTRVLVREHYKFNLPVKSA